MIFDLLLLGLPHPHGKRNNARFGLLTWTTLRVDHDGLAQIQPLTEILSTTQRLTVTHLKVDVNADRNLPQSTSSASPPLSIQSDTRVNETNQQLRKLKPIR